MFTKIKGFVKAHAVQVGTSVGICGAVVASAVPTFAAEGDPSMFVVTSSMASPIFTSISTSVTNMIPLGLGVMSIMIGVALIPRMIYKFL